MATLVSTASFCVAELGFFEFLLLSRDPRYLSAQNLPVKTPICKKIRTISLDGANLGRPSSSMAMESSSGSSASGAGSPSMGQEFGSSRRNSSSSPFKNRQPPGRKKALIPSVGKKLNYLVFGAMHPLPQAGSPRPVSRL
jgi:hypothetical protein